MSSALYSPLGFQLDEMTEAQRGMTPAEIEYFLLTGIAPDLSEPPRDPVDLAEEVPIFSAEDIKSYLNGDGVVTASAVYDTLKDYNRKNKKGGKK